ncbi:hypothetical protein ACWCWD_18270 [Streptomyces sp. NPDC001493]
MKRTPSQNAALIGRNGAMALVTLLLLVAGAWASWETAHHIILAKGREHGTLTVTGCGEETCTGTYTPDAQSPPRSGVIVTRSVAAQRGDEFPVVLKPGSAEAVRTGVPGFLHAWLPLGGSLILASLVLGGGLRLTRTAWAAGVAGAALLVATFLAL